MPLWCWCRLYDLELAGGGIKANLFKVKSGSAAIPRKSRFQITIKHVDDFCFLKKRYRSSSVITLIPFLFNNAVVTPSPSISFRENVPSYICPQPHEGLLDFPMNSSM